MTFFIILPLGLVLILLLRVVAFCSAILWSFIALASIVALARYLFGDEAIKFAFVAWQYICLVGIPGAFVVGLTFRAVQGVRKIVVRWS